MFYHVIPLAELKRHSVTYWLPGRDHRVSADAWVVLAERESGYSATVVDAQREDDDGHAAEDVLTLFLRDKGEPW